MYVCIIIRYKSTYLPTLQSTLGPAKFIAECNGQVYDDYSAMAVMRVSEEESLTDLLQAAGDDPDFDNEDYIYALACGIFLSSSKDVETVTEKMKEVVPFTDSRCVNLTEKFKLSKVDDKESYAFFLAYDYSSDTAKGKLYSKQVK